LILPSRSASWKARSGLGAVGEEAGGLPAHPPRQRRPAPLAEGSFEGVAVDAQPLGGLPQPDLAREGVGGLGPLAVLPVGARLGEAVAP
jgi:hypothetical protein